MIAIFKEMISYLIHCTYFSIKELKPIHQCIVQKDGQAGTKIEDLHLYMKYLHRSVTYWNLAKNDLIAQIHCLSPLMYFVTFSCNDLHWSDTRKALLIADGRPNDYPNNFEINGAQCLI